MMLRTKRGGSLRLGKLLDADTTRSRMIWEAVRKHKRVYKYWDCAYFFPANFKVDDLVTSRLPKTNVLEYKHFVSTIK